VRTFVWPFAVLASLFVLAACQSKPQPQTAAQTQPTKGAFRTRLTVKEIMGSMVEPSADALWNSVATNVTDKGPEVKAP
jgi:hypothetical protein